MSKQRDPEEMAGIVYRMIRDSNLDDLAWLLEMRKPTIFQAARNNGLYNRLDQEIAHATLYDRLSRVIRQRRFKIADPATCHLAFGKYMFVALDRIVIDLLRVNARRNSRTRQQPDSKSVRYDPTLPERVVRLLIPVALELPPAQRDAFMGVHRLHLSQSELAGVLEVSRQTVHANLGRAYTGLKARIAQHEELRAALDQVEILHRAAVGG